MKIQLEKSGLLTATNRLQGAITERSLAQIGLKIENNILKMSATDRVLAVYSDVECESMTNDVLFVPARLFSDVVKELPEGKVTFAKEAAYLVITAGADKQFMMKIPLIDDLSWKEPPGAFSGKSADIPTGKLSYMIEQVQFCVTQDSPRNYGSVGFFHKPNKDTIRLVGTDGFRLSYCEAEVAMSDNFLHNGICLSKRALQEIHRMCGEGFESIKISLSEDETTMLAEVSQYQIYIRLSAVKYPNYVGVLPEKKMERVLISRPHMQHVARRVLLAADKSRALQLCFSDASLTLNSKTMGSSEGWENVPVEDYHGPKFEVAINGKFLTDVFATTVSDNVTLQFNQKSSDDPIVITPRTEPSACRSKHVLVPIKQNQS